MKVKLYKTVMDLVDKGILTEDEADDVFEQYACNSKSLSEIIRSVLKNDRVNIQGEDYDHYVFITPDYRAFKNIDSAQKYLNTRKPYHSAIVIRGVRLPIKSIEASNI